MEVIETLIKDALTPQQFLSFLKENEDTVFKTRAICGCPIQAYLASCLPDDYEYEVILNNVWVWKDNDIVVSLPNHPWVNMFINRVDDNFNHITGRQAAAVLLEVTS